MSYIYSRSFGEDVKERLYRLNLTQTELAEKLGITAAYLNDILLNRRRARQKREQIVELLKEMESGATRQ